MTRMRCQEIFERSESVQFLNGMSRDRNCLFQLLTRAPDIQVESKGFRLGGFRDSLPQGGDLRCRKPIRSICVNVLPALSVRAGRGTLPRPISKCQFLSS